MTTPDDRDAWLAEALRHAPDADALPPPAVSEAILREARAKARSGVAAQVAAKHDARWPRRLWHWLGQPGAAASLAGVMVAVLVGVMWRGQPLPEPMAPRDEAPAASVASRPPPAPAAAPMPREHRIGDTARSPRAAPAAAAKRHEALAAARSDTAANRPPIAALRAQLTADAPRWSVRRGSEPAQPVDAAMQAWLAELDAAASAWTADAAPADIGGESLTLLRDGQAMHTLQLGDTAARWTTEAGRAADARSWRALVPQAHALRDSLDRALPR